MSRTRALIVGAGLMGRRHADAIIASGDSVTVVVDADSARAKTLAPGAVVAQSLDEALTMRERFDVAVVATPSGLHVTQAAALLAADCPVLIEKPHRVPGQASDELQQLLKTSKGYAFIGMSTRHWPGMEELAAAVSDGALGEILTYRDRIGFLLDSHSLPEWYFQPGSSGGGILVTNGVHAIDRVRTLLGEFVVERTESAKLMAGHDVETYALLEGRAGTARVVIELLWTPYEPQATAVVVTGTLGNAIVRMDGSWTIATDSDVRCGGAIDTDGVPFTRQWRAFLERRSGFSWDDLEPTLSLIEQIYEEDSDA